MFATPGQLKILNQSMNSEKTERKFENQQGESSDSRDFVKIQKNLLLAGDCPCPFNPFHGYCLHEAATPECLASGARRWEDEHSPWPLRSFAVFSYAFQLLNGPFFWDQRIFKKRQVPCKHLQMMITVQFFFIQMGFFLLNVTNLIKWLQQLIKHY